MLCCFRWFQFGISFRRKFDVIHEINTWKETESNEMRHQIHGVNNNLLFSGEQLKFYRYNSMNHPRGTRTRAPTTKRTLHNIDPHFIIVHFIYPLVRACIGHTILRWCVCICVCLCLFVLFLCFEIRWTLFFIIFYFGLKVGPFTHISTK